MPRAHMMHDASGSAGIETWGGVLSGTLEEWAAALDCDPAEVVEAIEAAGIETLVDTARQNPGTRKEQDRPTAPELRSVAMVPSEAEALRDAVEAGGTSQDSEQLPPERRGKIGSAVET